MGSVIWGLGNGATLATTTQNVTAGLRAAKGSQHLDISYEICVDFACVCIYTYNYMYVSEYELCMHVCMHVCMLTCMHACMYVRIYIYIYTFLAMSSGR